MSTNDKEHAAEKRFAANFFSGAPDAAADDDEGANEHSDEQRQWVRDLFATIGNQDDDVLAGLKSGRTVGRTTPPRAPEATRDEFRFS